MWKPCAKCCAVLQMPGRLLLARQGIWGWLLPLGVFCATLPLLWYHAAPGISFHDSGEFALAAMSAGVPHPPGAPTWTILASVFLKLGNFDDAARGTNVFSATCGALALGLWAAVSMGWARRSTKSVWWGLAAGVATPLCLLHSPAFLEQSFLTEQYTLMLALLGLILLIGQLPYRAHGWRQSGWCVLLGIVWGLALGNHPSQVCLIPFMLAVVLLATRVWPAVLRLLACIAGGLLLGLLVFMWVPLRSRAEPLMDWGNVETLGRFLWSVSRSQWQSRSIFDAPPGFAVEWLRSYRILTEMGAGVCGLGIFGFAVFAARLPRRAILMVLAVVPYLATMLIGHMRQDRMDISYIRHYGVSDWHLPLYAAASTVAAVGMAAVGLALTKSGWPGVGKASTMLILVALALTSALSVQSNSLRRFVAPVEFLAAVKEPLPKNAIVVTTADNLSHMLAYDRYGRNKNQDQWVGYGFNPVSAVIGTLVKSGDSWTTDAKFRYLTKTIASPDQQPLRVASLQEAEAENRPLFSDYRRQSGGSPYMLPHGFLFSVHADRTTTEQALAADDIYRRKLPKFSKAQEYHRMEREAYGLLYEYRAAYFRDRRLLNRARQNYEEALKWLPDHGTMWFLLGDLYDRANRTGDAITAYRKATHFAPGLAGPRMNLAVIHAVRNNFDEAERLLVEELRVAPNDQRVRENLRRVRKDRASASPKLR
jgi:tetratricopeptide (TPR) repeat protein